MMYSNILPFYTCCLTRSFHLMSQSSERRGNSSVYRTQTSQFGFRLSFTLTQCIVPPSQPVLAFVESPPMACKVLSIPLYFVKSTRLLAITSAGLTDFGHFSGVK